MDDRTETWRDRENTNLFYRATNYRKLWGSESDNPRPEGTRLIENLRIFRFTKTKEPINVVIRIAPAFKVDLTNQKTQHKVGFLTHYLKTNSIVNVF